MLLERMLLLHRPESPLSCLDSLVAHASACSGELQFAVWTLDIFSGGGAEAEVFPLDLEAERCQQFGGFGHFFAQQGDQVEAGGPVGVSSPLRQRLIVRIASGTER